MAYEERRPPSFIQRNTKSDQTPRTRISSRSTIGSLAVKHSGPQNSGQSLSHPRLQSGAFSVQQSSLGKSRRPCSSSSPSPLDVSPRLCRLSSGRLQEVRLTELSFSPHPTFRRHDFFVCFYCASLPYADFCLVLRHAAYVHASCDRHFFIPQYLEPRRKRVFSVL